MQYGLLLLGEHAPERLLTLARFAETHGHDQDVPRDNAWPCKPPHFEARV